MALKFFIFCIILSPFLLVNNSVVEHTPIALNKEVPNITFINSVMYDINTNNVDKRVYSREANRYENKEELYNADLLLRNANNNSDTIKAEYMKKENNIYYFQKNVVFKRDVDLELKTDSIQYDITSGIATNQVDFFFKYKNSFFSGKNLYLSRNDYAISGDNAHFIINKEDL
ncbi:MAG: hypothetical protein RBT59_06675 [Arcobacteraceae bacterium]|jgi:hypothetical protein|nr:hypothetical protein [Arcobacteraceae bacterium]